MILKLSAISKSFKSGDKQLNILDEFDLAINPGEQVALVGASGSGKSTLLHIAGLLDSPNRGDVIIDGVNTTKLSDKRKTLLRREKLGFIYQFHHLLPEFTALENIMMPQLIAGVNKQQAKDKALELLDSLGLSDRATHKPSKLSGGQQQRVAIARAIANNPVLLLADEPTGNLDNENSDKVFELLTKIIKQHKMAALIATHNTQLASKMDRVVTVK